MWAEHVQFIRDRCGGIPGRVGVCDLDGHIDRVCKVITDLAPHAIECRHIWSTADVGADTYPPEFVEMWDRRIRWCLNGTDFAGAVVVGVARTFYDMSYEIQRLMARMRSDKHLQVLNFSVGRTIASELSHISTLYNLRNTKKLYSDVLNHPIYTPTIHQGRVWFARTLQQARQNNILVCVSKGNVPFDAEFPTAHVQIVSGTPGLLNVGACTLDGTLWEGTAPVAGGYTAPGAALELSVGDWRWGTSYSAPYVAATIALMVGAEPTLTASEALGVLNTTGKMLHDKSVRVDVVKAVEQVRKLRKVR